MSTSNITDQELTEPECPICLEEIATDQPIFNCACPHAYHEQCLIDWFKPKPAAERVCLMCRVLTPWGLRTPPNHGRSIIMAYSRQQVRSNGPLFDELRGASAAEICTAYLRTLHPTVWYSDLNAQQRLELLEFHRGRSLFNRWGWRYRDLGSDLLKEIPNEYRANFKSLIDDRTVTHVGFRDGNSVVVSRLITEDLLQKIRQIRPHAIRRYETAHELVSHAWFLLAWVIDTYDCRHPPANLWPNHNTEVGITAATLSPWRTAPDDLSEMVSVAVEDAINEGRNSLGWPQV